MKTHLRVRGGDGVGLQYYACGLCDRLDIINAGEGLHPSIKPLPSTDERREVTCGNCARAWQCIWGEPEGE